MALSIKQLGQILTPLPWGTQAPLALPEQLLQAEAAPRLGNLRASSRELRESKTPAGEQLSCRWGRQRGGSGALSPSCPAARAGSEQQGQRQVRPAGQLPPRAAGWGGSPKGTGISPAILRAELPIKAIPTVYSRAIKMKKKKTHKKNSLGG